MTETIKISELPNAGVLDGTERVPIVKGGVTKITTTQQIGNLFNGDFPSLQVAQGGTGRTSLDAYALIAGGTTSTGAVQSVSGTGTTGQALVSNGASALPTWQSLPAAVGQALTKADDTNVTLTLGGSPTTALLSSTSITAGWSGQLAISRGGTGQATASAAFDALAPTTTRGDLIFRNATTNTRLAASTSGYLLQTNGVGTDPTWAGFLQSGTDALVRSWQDKAADWISVMDFIPESLHAGIRDGSNVTALQTYIQAAVTAASGKTLYFPPGVYLVTAATATAAVTLPVAGIRLVGSGRYSSTITCGAAVACVMMAAVDAEKIEIIGLGFDGNNNGTRLGWQRALILRGVLDVNVEGCLFYRIGDGGLLFGKQGFGGSDNVPNGTRQPKRVRVLDCDWVDCRGTVCLLSKYTGIDDWQASHNRFRDSCTIGISVESENGGTDFSKRTIVTNNTVTGCSYAYSSGLSPVAWGISIGELVENVVCANNVIDGVAGDTIAAGINISTSPSQTDEVTRRILVASNTINSVSATGGNGAYGVLVQAGDTSLTDTIVSGNVITGVRRGIAIECDSSATTLGYVRGITIDANNIIAPAEFGIITLTTSSSGSLPMIDFAITGNVIREAGSHGITVFAKDGAICSNKISDCGGIGISFLSGCDQLTVSANQISASGQSGMSGAISNSTITSNASLNNGQGGGTNYGLYITSGTNNLVHSNNLSDTQGSPTQSYGLRATATTRAFNNDIIGNAAGTIFGGLTSINTGIFDIAHNRTSVTGPVLGMSNSWRILANSGVQVSHTGDLNETTLATVTVPAGAMGANGAVRITVLYSWTNSGNTKTPRIRFGGTGGTIYHGFSATTTNGEQAMIIIRNRNNVASQVGQIAAYSGLGNMSSAPLTSAVDTSAAVDILIRGILTNITETISLEGYTVELLYGT